MNIKINVLIGVKEQCALYPSMLSLLAVESGIIVHIVDIADAIAPAIKINNNNIFVDNLIIFLIVIENQIHIKSSNINTLEQYLASYES